MQLQPANLGKIAPLVVGGVSPPLENRNPVFLVHGLMDTSYKMRKIASYLRGLGWEVFDIDLQPNNGETRLEILAQQLAAKIDRTFAPDRQIDLLGFSMGGLVSRYYLQRLGGMQRVQRFITISTPHKGTIAANFSMRPGCMQMRPQSAFMQDLSSDVDRLQELNFTSLWTPFDLIILPPSSSQLGIGTEMSFPVLTHPQMVTDPRTLTAISAALAQPVTSPMRSNSVAPKIDSGCV
jgi:triacylglycerol lipase